MKAKHLAIILFVLFLVGSIAPIGQTSAAEKSTFTAMEIFCPLPFCNPPVGAILFPGTLTCPGNDPTGNPAQPCPEGSNLHLRGNKRLAQLFSSDPRVNGWITLEANANWNAEFAGPIWGTFSITLDAGGTWDGTWQGSRRREGDQWSVLIRALGHGTEGMVDGMQLRLVEEFVTDCPVLCPHTTIVEVRILDPHSN